MYKIPAKSLFVGKNLVFLPECHSTNTYLLDLVRAGSVPEGTLVITHNQTAGRGQRSNQWHAEPGLNLTFSILLTPRFLAPKDQFLLSKAVALAVADTVADFTSVTARVKWPNDVIVDGKKASGILIENQLEGSTYATAVVGIGLNVNQTEFSVPTATSLRRVTDHELDLNNVLESACCHLEARYLQMKSSQWQMLNYDYERALHWRGERHQFSARGRTFEGVIEGVDERGFLVVASERERQAFDLKEILYLN